MARAPRRAEEIEDVGEETTEGVETVEADENAGEEAVRGNKDAPPSSSDVSLASLCFDEGWHEIDSAPANGRPVVVGGFTTQTPIPIPLVTPAYKHNSRAWRGSHTRWEPFTEWRILNTPTRLPFDPVAWTRYE
jgi:hypothetical protein